MPKKLNLDYINYLADKWRHHLLEKENPSFLENGEEMKTKKEEKFWKK